MTKRELLQTILKGIATRILRKYAPKIVGITGSVGKTSTKEAVFTVLNARFDVRKSEKNFNNEVGVPLTIIGVDAGKGILGWFRVFAHGISLILWRHRYYPEILVLEMGVDRPGDMEYMTSFVPVDIGIVTLIGTSHLEYFEDRNELAKEKMKLLSRMNKSGTAIINADDELQKKGAMKLKCDILTYGFDQDATVSADPNASIAKLPDGTSEEYRGITTKVNYQGSHIPVQLPHVMSRQHIYAALAAIAVGTAFNMNLVDIAKALREFKPLPGRMQLLVGVRGSWIIDDTYNAAPESMIAALQTLETLESVHGKRIAVLGDMLELGEETVAAHERVAETAKNAADVVITVGQRGKIIAERLRSLGFSKENLHVCDRSLGEREEENPGRILEKLLKKGDVALVKGSRAMHMERIVKEVMAKPEDAETLLILH